MDKPSFDQNRLRTEYIYAIRRQDYDDLLEYIYQHRDRLGKELVAYAKILEAFTILDSYTYDVPWHCDYGDEQCDAIYKLTGAIQAAFPDFPTEQRVEDAEEDEAGNLDI